MPTYGARGITATLRVADLQPTLAKKLNTGMGSDAHQEGVGAANILKEGRQLYETPIGADDSSLTRVMRSIGEFEDMALFMVEAGEHLIPLAERMGVRQSKETQLSPLPATIQSSPFGNTASSPLTSLGTTPSVGTPDSAFQVSQQQLDSPAFPRRDSRMLDTERSLDVATLPRPIPAPFQDQSAPASSHQAQALSLVIDTTEKSYPDRKDTKVEVFLNGTLVDTDFINARRDGPKNSAVYSFHFHGVRVHRQIEKPWLYRAASSASGSSYTAEQRWASVAKALKDEASSRGVNEKGMPAPSVEYLTALAAAAFPGHLKAKAGLSIIDVVITTGKGRKGRSDQAYTLVPCRLEPPGKQQGALPDADDPFIDTAEEGNPGTDSEGLQPTATLPPSKRSRSIQAPQPQMHGSPAAISRGAVNAAKNGFGVFSAKPAPPAPSSIWSSQHKKTANQEKAEKIATSLGIYHLMGTIVHNWRDRRGRLQDDRAVKDRLIDILKMSPENQEKCKQQLVDLLKEQGALPGGTSSSNTKQSSPKKKRETDTKAKKQADTRDVPNASDVMVPDTTGDPVASLAQNRMDMAMDLGIAPNGRLAQRIESLSPHRSPTKRLGASPWAKKSDEEDSQEEYSAEDEREGKSATPSKPPRRRSRKKVASSDMSSNQPATSDGPAAQTPKLPVLKLQPQPQPHPRKQAEQSHANAAESLKAFQIPELCHGGSITYAGGDQHRQISKVRVGEFEEDELVVGMRFCVI